MESRGGFRLRPCGEAATAARCEKPPAATRRPPPGANPGPRRRGDGRPAQSRPVAKRRRPPCPNPRSRRRGDARPARIPARGEAATPARNAPPGRGRSDLCPMARQPPTKKPGGPQMRAARYPTAGRSRRPRVDSPQSSCRKSRRRAGPPGTASRSTAGAAPRCPGSPRTPR